MVITVATVGEVQVPSDDIVHMISMWNGWMPAARAMAMAGIMFIASMRRGAGSGILTGDGDRMLVDVIVMDVMQVAVVEVVGMAVMGDRLVAAACGVTMRMIVMRRMGTHWQTPSVKVVDGLNSL